MKKWLTIIVWTGLVGLIGCENPFFNGRTSGTSGKCEAGTPISISEVTDQDRLRTIGVAEIKRNPGGNRDISRVMQSLPGRIQISPSFRNDLIVRGGSPNENRFYLEGIEVPLINHFTTQGASGGPVGMLNVDFIKEVSFYAGAFPANRGNALSRVIEFDYKDAREDKPQVSFTVGATDLAATLETPLTKNSGLIIGWRRSYLQFLFQALELPFLPKYDDLQFKYENKLSKKDILEVVGIGTRS